MKILLEQLKQRRLELGLKQHDMMLRVGISRQQYQYLESKGNPRLETLELVTKGLNCELMLIPQEKLNAVKAVLKNGDLATPGVDHGMSHVDGQPFEENSLANDPWKDLLDDL